MAKVTTKTGDSGMTGLLAKARVPKSDPRIEALGAEARLAPNREVLRYLNRLSDLVFVLARAVEVGRGGSTLARPA